MVGQGQKYNAWRIPQREAKIKMVGQGEKYNTLLQREASRLLPWLDKDRNITLWRTPQREASRLKWLGEKYNILENTKEREI